VTRIRELGRNLIQEIKWKFLYAAEEERQGLKYCCLVSQKWTSIKFDTGEIETFRKEWR
jgi:hypothetical protein